MANSLTKHGIKIYSQSLTMYFYFTYPTLHILDSRSAHKINKYVVRHLSPHPILPRSRDQEDKCVAISMPTITVMQHKVFDSYVLVGTVK
jgi:hypothetical protein